MQSEATEKPRVRTRWAKAELAVARSLLRDFDPNREPLEAWVATVVHRFPGRDQKAVLKKLAQLAGLPPRKARRRKAAGTGAADAPGESLAIPPALMQGTLELLAARSAILRVRERIHRLEAELAQLRQEEQRLVAEYQPKLAEMMRQELSV